MNAVFSILGAQEIISWSGNFDFNNPIRGLVHISGSSSPAHTPDGSSYGYWWAFTSPGQGDIIQFAFRIQNFNGIWFRIGRFNSPWGNITVNFN